MRSLRSAFGALAAPAPAPAPPAQPALAPPAGALAPPRRRSPSSSVGRLDGPARRPTAGGGGADGPGGPPNAGGGRAAGVAVAPASLVSVPRADADRLVAAPTRSIPHWRVRRDRALPSLPIAVWAGLATVLAGGVVLVAMALVLSTASVPQEAMRAAIGVGVSAALAAAAIVALLAARLGGQLRRLRDDAVRRLADPGAPARRTDDSRVLSAGTEVAELTRTLDALHQRVQVADQVAARHLRSAEQASIGMAEVLSGLVAAEESARGQLSAELHDTAAQSLAVARGLLHGAAGCSPLDAADVLRAVADAVEDAEEQVRAVMARTRPPALRDGDLAAAVQGLCDDMAERYGLLVHLGWPSTPAPLPLSSAVTAYRFFQEALLNVVKHADVDAAVATLALDDGWVRAVVHDDGPGFDPEQVRPERGRHVGLELLGERARLAGGSLTVMSQPHQGTTLTLTLPRRVGAAVAAPTG